MKYTRDLMAFAIVMIFAYGFHMNPTAPGYEETVKNIMLIAVGFYLGGSKFGTEAASKNADAITASLRANAEPQAVVVTNDEASPVPVEAR